MEKNVKNIVIGGVLTAIGLIFYNYSLETKTEAVYSWYLGYQIPAGVAEVHPYGYLATPGILLAVAGIILIIVGILSYQKTKKGE